MTEFNTLIQQSAAHAWLFVPSAILLGALHGLEPGHSKTMMAAFIVAVRGTIGQAVLLAISATISHTAIVWVVALVALTFGKNWNAETGEPYFQIASGAIIVGMALWMMFRTRRDQLRAKRAAQHDHHAHEHQPESMSAVQSGHTHGHEHQHAEQNESHHHAGLSLDAPDYEDSHERAHAREIRQRFAAKGTATTGQVILFGLTGGLLPCPAAVTVLLLCLQLQRFWLGIVLVLCFSIGLALTLMLSGVLAAWGTRHVTSRWKGFEVFSRRAPYFASIIIMIVGCIVAIQGFSAL